MTLFKNFIRSLRHALAGIRYAFQSERNFQIELVAGLAVVLLALFFPLTPVERSIIFFLVGFVLTLELVNTAFERMLDLVKPRVHPYVKVVKDVVAGSVLISAVAAGIIGIYLFAPYLWYFVPALIR